MSRLLAGDDLRRQHLHDVVRSPLDVDRFHLAQFAISCHCHNLTAGLHFKHGVQVSYLPPTTVADVENDENPRRKLPMCNCQARGLK